MIWWSLGLYIFLKDLINIFKIVIYYLLHYFLIYVKDLLLNVVIIAKYLYVFAKGFNLYINSLKKKGIIFLKMTDLIESMDKH